MIHGGPPDVYRIQNMIRTVDSEEGSHYLRVSGKKLPCFRIVTSGMIHVEIGALSRRSRLTSAGTWGSRTCGVCFSQVVIIYPKTPQQIYASCPRIKCHLMARPPTRPDRI